MRNLYTNHGLVLMRIWMDPKVTLSEIAAAVGVKEKVGRRNRYHVSLHRALDYQPLPNITVREQIIAITRMMGMSPPDSEAARSS
jgi:hypothetical protein